MRMTTGLMIVLLTLCTVVVAQEPATQPSVVDAADKEAIAANMNKDVVLEGTVSRAEWSRSGAVMNIDFKGADESRMLAVIFQRTRERMDEAFAGDIAKTLTGAKVRIRGRIVEYGGRAESFRGRPQIIINAPAQITILELGPSTQPAE